MDSGQLERIKNLIDELRDLRQASDAAVYGHYSGAISRLRQVLRLYGHDYEPGT